MILVVANVVAQWWLIPLVIVFFIDLELAAEIGKNLLERNKELEVMLKSSHQYLEEQTVKNEVSKINKV